MSETKETVTTVLQPVDLNAWLAEKDNAHVAELLKDGENVTDKDGRVIGRVGAHARVDIQRANTKVAEKKFDAEYVAVSAITMEGASILMGGIVDETFKGEGDDKREVPSVIKYFNQGFGILARNACAARIRVNAEGPDKALLQAAKQLAKAKGWDYSEGSEGLAKALAKVRALAAED